MTLRVAITGASGLVGSHLASNLSARGDEVHALVRRPASGGGPTVLDAAAHSFVLRRSAAPSDISWDPSAGTIDAAALEGMNAVVHLAGESIASGRWTDELRRRIVTSRTAGTSLIARTLASLAAPPRVLVCASAIGFYGSRGPAELDETSGRGKGFLADVCDQWEKAAAPARAAGIRVVHLRFGVVLSPRGGALAQMLPAFRYGGGAVVGSGDQWMSWISIDDAVRAIVHALETPSLEGAVNATAPSPVTNRDFTVALAQALGRPAFLRVPAFALRLAFGEMADELLLSSARVLPKKLLASGFEFAHPQVGPALAALLQDDRPPSDAGRRADSSRASNEGRQT